MSYVDDPPPLLTPPATPYLCMTVELISILHELKKSSTLSSV